ncbi:MAG: beta-lactamase family protein [Alphaproteobacteria bacterium]|nr:MAG: beta-lactamase family protein [Alphaproteobacteria bacterium]
MPNSSEAPKAPITAFISDLDRLAAETMTDWKVPGAALAVVHDDKVVLTRAYGQRDVEANLPVTPATQFAILSITKSFTATALALLHHEGRLDWSKPVRDILPEFRLSDPVGPTGSRSSTCYVIAPGCRAMTGCMSRAISHRPTCSAVCGILNSAAIFALAINITTFASTSLA